jgi:hypothetical protein
MQCCISVAMKRDARECGLKTTFLKSKYAMSTKPNCTKMLKASGEAFKDDAADFRRYGSARKLYDFNIDTVGVH